MIEGKLIGETFSIDFNGCIILVYYGFKSYKVKPDYAQDVLKYEIIDVKHVGGHSLCYWTHGNDTLIRIDKDYMIKRDGNNLWLEEDEALR